MEDTLVDETKNTSQDNTDRTPVTKHNHESTAQHFKWQEKAELALRE
ncbi:phage shock protein PspA, partial [Salmonella sp. zj-f60]|nr:phage shock protein PspA [Salmonella sp. zj-f60]